ncbi:MAG: hypothetical protein EBS05_17995 [Proteobacteria bacterium]|jgi:predicted transcriptional regulator|nr:hypothetical protein [Pseudomonadota bacterium]
MSDRQLALEAVQKIPEAASLSVVLDDLAMLASIQAGLAQSDRGEGVPHELVKAMAGAWISKSSGLRVA